MSTTRINSSNLTKNANFNKLTKNLSCNIDSPFEKTKKTQEHLNEPNAFSFQHPQSNVNIHFPLILKYKEFFGIYLQILARIILKAKKIDVYNLMNKLFVSNDLFNELLRIYTTNIFNELFEILLNETNITHENPKEKNVQDESSYFINENISKKQSMLFINCHRVLFYYKVVCIMCKNVIEKEKLQKTNKEKTDQKKEWKSIIRKIFINMLYLIKPSNGILPKYLNISSEINSFLISQKEEDSPSFIIKYNILKEVYQFICLAFSFDETFSCFLTDDISSFYIRYSYINFVKLYSYSSNHELNEINLKLNEIKTKMNENKAQETAIKKNLEEIINKKNASEENFKNQIGNQKRFKSTLMKLYLKCLFALGNNRTEDIKRKFYQYRVVEFFTREIDLEYEVLYLFIFIFYMKKYFKTLDHSNKRKILKN